MPTPMKQIIILKIILRLGLRFFISSMRAIKKNEKTKKKLKKLL